MTYTPPVPDGPDCPWTRGRRTRWWCVIPADLLVVGLVACAGAASLHNNTSPVAMVLPGLAAVVIGWAVGWVWTRPNDHLDAVGRGSLLGIALTWLVWVVVWLLSGGTQGTTVAAMLACFLLTGLGGWRWLYGFAKAQESLTPRAIQRRLDAQRECEGIQTPSSDLPADDSNLPSDAAAH